MAGGRGCGQGGDRLAGPPPHPDPHPTPPPLQSGWNILSFATLGGASFLSFTGVSRTPTLPPLSSTRPTTSLSTWYQSDLPHWYQSGWNMLSFGTPGKASFLSFTGLEGAPSMLTPENFKAHFQEQTGGWYYYYPTILLYYFTTVLVSYYYTTILLSVLTPKNFKSHFKEQTGSLSAPYTTNILLSSITLYDYTAILLLYIFTTMPRCADAPMRLLSDTPIFIYSYTHIRPPPSHPLSSMECLVSSNAVLLYY